MSMPQASTKNEYVYEELHRRIMTGELVEGQTIAQAPLARELGVSTTPMREALRRLGAEGLVTIDAHRDARVAELTATGARNLFEIRERIDPLAAGLAALRRTSFDVARIENAATILRPLSESTDLEGMMAHRDFHRTIYNASHNDVLIAVLDSIWDKADRYRQVSLRTSAVPRKELARVAREHEQLARAVISGDAEAAETVACQHVVRSLGRRAIDAL